MSIPRATTIANDSSFCESRQNMKKLEDDLTSEDAMNAPLQLAGGGLHRLEVAARTHSLRETNVALARANLELAELVERRQRMVLEVSHDLRTPLTSIKGAAQFLGTNLASKLGITPEDLTRATDQSDPTTVSLPFA